MKPEYPEYECCHFASFAFCIGDQVRSRGIMLPSIRLPAQSAQLSVITFHHQNQSYKNKNTWTCIIMIRTTEKIRENIFGRWNIHQCLVTNGWIWVWQNSKVLTADPVMVISAFASLLLNCIFNEASNISAVSGNFCQVVTTEHLSASNLSKERAQWTDRGNGLIIIHWKWSIKEVKGIRAGCEGLYGA